MAGAVPRRVDANEVLEVVEWALAFTWAVGLVALWRLLAKQRDLEARVRALESDRLHLTRIADAFGEDCVYALADPEREVRL